MEPFRFIHLSDLHFRRQFEDRGFQALLKKLPNALENLTACLKREKEQGLDFILLTGDLSHDGDREDYSILRDTLDGAGVPWVALPGNHDNREAFEQALLTRGKCDCLNAVYHVEGLRVITLDTGSGVSGVLEHSQTHWLREVLSVPSEKRSILAVHHPLVPDQEGLGTIRMDREIPELIANSDVIGIFCGHTHRNYAGRFAGKPYFTADSMSYVMEEFGKNTYLKSAAAYNRVVLRDGELSVQVRQLAPAPVVAACFPTNTMSVLFSKEKVRK